MELWTLLWCTSLFLAFVILAQSIEDQVISKFLGKHDCRYSTFLKALQLMRERNLFRIVETGSLRSDLDRCHGDGCSTAIFGEWSNQMDGITVDSVDLSERAVETSRRILAGFPFVTNHLGDSLDFLKPSGKKIAPNSNLAEDYIDLLYLDSFDFDWGNPDPSQQHHLKEIKTAYPRLHQDSIVMMDDCSLPHGGKCKLMEKFLLDHGWKVVAQAYQKVLVADGVARETLPACQNVIPLYSIQEMIIKELPNCTSNSATARVTLGILSQRSDNQRRRFVEVGTAPAFQIIDGRYGWIERLFLRCNNDNLKYIPSQPIDIVFFQATENFNDIYELLLQLYPFYHIDTTLIFHTGGDRDSNAELRQDISVFLRWKGWQTQVNYPDLMVWRADKNYWPIYN